MQTEPSPGTPHHPKYQVLLRVKPGYCPGTMLLWPGIVIANFEAFGSYSVIPVYFFIKFGFAHHWPRNHRPLEVDLGRAIRSHNKTNTGRQLW